MAQESFVAPQFESINSLALRSLLTQLSQPYLTTGKAIALTVQTFVSNMMSLLFNRLSRFVIAFLPRSKCLFYSVIQIPSIHCPLTLDTYSSVLHLYSFAISRMFYKCIHPESEFGDWPFFAQHNSLEMHPGYYMYHKFSPFYYWVIFHGVAGLLIHSPTEGHLRYFWFRAIKNKSCPEHCVPTSV